MYIYICIRNSLLPVLDNRQNQLYEKEKEKNEADCRRTCSLICSRWGKSRRTIFPLFQKLSVRCLLRNKEKWPHIRYFKFLWLHLNCNSCQLWVMVAVFYERCKWGQGSRHVRSFTNFAVAFGYFQILPKLGSFPW